MHDAVHDGAKLPPRAPGAPHATRPIRAQVVEEVRDASEVAGCDLAPRFDLFGVVKRSERAAALVKRERECMEEGGTMTGV